jgi:hypothetical protein
MEMCRVKWFLPADDRPFDPVGRILSSSRATRASLQSGAEGPKAARIALGEHVDQLMRTQTSHDPGAPAPCVAIVRSPGVTEVTPRPALPPRGRRPRTGRRDV